MRPSLIIFDFDGVVADSEGIANQVLADFATELGAPMTREYALEHFTGRRVSDVRAEIEALIGRPAQQFPGILLARTLAAFKSDLLEIHGLSAFLADHIDLRRCIASSSSHERIDFCLEVLGLTGRFDPVVSADDVARGKPAPDVFLRASDLAGVSPAACVVIEDSPGGVRAGISAGMRVVGLLAASHLGRNHREALRAAGATHIAESYADLAEILDEM